MALRVFEKEDRNMCPSGSRLVVLSCRWSDLCRDRGVRDRARVRVSCEHVDPGAGAR